MTPTTIGWVLADGYDGGAAALASAEFTVQPGPNRIGAVNAAEQTAAAVLQVQTMLTARGERLHGIGVTWSADAAVAAALLVECLTDAGFDNVVPVRLHQAAADGFTEPEPQLALARGAAQALQPSRELSGISADAPPDDLPTLGQPSDPVRSRTVSYAGALAMLAAGSVGFVVSLSIALSVQLNPAKDAQPAHHQVATAPVVSPTAPIVTPAAAHAAAPSAAGPEVPPEAPAVLDPPAGEDPPGVDGQ